MSVTFMEFYFLNPNKFYNELSGKEKNPLEDWQGSRGKITILKYARALFFKLGSKEILLAEPKLWEFYQSQMTWGKDVLKLAPSSHVPLNLWQWGMEEHL